MKLLNDPMVKLLIDKFDLETPPINVLEISKYELDGDCIKIKEITVPLIADVKIVDKWGEAK